MKIIALLILKVTHGLHFGGSREKSSGSLQLQASIDATSSRGLWWREPSISKSEDPIWWQSQSTRFTSLTEDCLVHGEQSMGKAHIAAFPENSRTFSKDWLHCLRTWPKSFVLRRIRQPLYWIIIWSAVISVWASLHPLLSTASRPSLNCGTGLHTLVGGALSLLLVFRTNTAYHRYWEGRQIFDRLSTRTRDLADFFANFESEVGHLRTKRLAALLRAFPIALQLHLQGFSYHRENLAFSATSDATHTSVGEREVRRLFERLGGHPSGAGEIPYSVFLKQLRSSRDLGAALGVPTDLDEAQALNQLHWLKFDRQRRYPSDKGMSLYELAKYYQPLQLWETLAAAGTENRHAIASSNNMPLAISSMISREAKAIPLHEDTFTSRERMWIISNIANLRATISASERIVQTPVPLHYARHTSRFLSVWCLTLPLCLVHQIPPLFLPPVVALISWSLIGLREIGLLIENPFRRSLQLIMVTDTIGAEINDTFKLHRTIGKVSSSSSTSADQQQQQQYAHSPGPLRSNNDSEKAATVSAQQSPHYQPQPVLSR